ncbi:hypothetical protein IJS98_06595 [bacterium]|nr:hypothetical protein [bacterium]
MKLLNFLLAVLVAVSIMAASAQAEVLWSEDFESYEAGTEIVGTVDGWRFFSDAYAGTSTIVQDGDAKVLKLSKKSGQSDDYDMILTPRVTVGTANKGRELTKISFKFRPGSGNDLFALYGIHGTQASRFFYLNFNVNTGECSSNPGGLKFDNVNKDSYSECYFIYDAFNGKVVEVSINGQSQACDIFCPDFADEVLIRLSTRYSQMSSHEEAYYDSILVETQQRYENPGIFAPDVITIPIGTTELQASIYNGGPDAEIGFTVTGGADWLTINPTSGTLTSTKDIYFQCDPEKERGCYEATVTFDGGEYGSVTTKVIWQNGFFYQSHFGDMELGDILPQDSRWQSIYSYGREKENYDIIEGGYEGHEKCLKIWQDGYGGTHTTFANTENTADKYNIKVSFRVKIDDVIGGSGIYFGSNDGAGEFYLQDRDGNLRLHSNAANYDFPIDYEDYLGKWVYVSYTMNMLEGNYRLLEMQFGENVVTGLDLYHGNGKDVYPRFRFFTYNDSSNTAYLDELSAEAVPKEIGGPTLEVVGGGIVWATGTNSVQMTVYNMGEGELTFESTVEQGSGWLSIRELEEGESYSATIVGQNSITLNLDVDREALGLEYGVAKIKTTGSDGRTKYTRVAAQGHTEDGYVFYASDFETTDLGVINVVDPAWLNPNGKVIIDDDNRCLSVQIPDSVSMDQLHCRVNVPDKLYDEYNFRVSCKVKCVGSTFPQLTFGTDLDHRQGELTLNCNGEEAVFKPVETEDPDCITNTAPMNTWFDLSYTYNSDPLNRKLLAVTFAGCEYEFEDLYITAVNNYGFFNEFRFFIWSHNDPYLIDDFRIEAIKKPNTAPVMNVVVPGNPIAYTAKSADVIVRNDGGNSFKFTAEVVEGSEYLKVTSATNEVFGSFTLPVTIDRSKMGFGFYRPTVRITSDIAGQAPIDVNLAIQSGTPEEGYVMYQSDFANLAPTTVIEGGVIGELSEQDNCWDKCTAHNNAIITEDPAGSGKNVACFVNCNDWSAYTGYQLGLNIPTNACENFDVIFAMDMYIPDTYIDREGEEHPNANFFVSQKDNNRQCEAQFFLNTDKTDSPVEMRLEDIQTRDEWYERTSAEGIPVPNNTWFPFYMRFNTKLIEYDHKTLYAVNFGENEYQMEDEDSWLSYPGGVSPAVLGNEGINRLKFWSYFDDANICMDNVRILLVPKGLPEPALFGILALIALAFARKQR